VIYEEQPPRAPLDRYVECVWRLRGCAGGVQRILPDGCPELIFHLGEPFHLWTAPQARDRQPPALLVGPSSRFLLLEPPGRPHTVGVRFRPAGASAFFPAPLDEFADRTIDLTALWGAAARELIERIEAAPGFPAIVALAESALLRRLRAPDARMLHAARAILTTGGQSAVPALAREVALSPRQFERRFAAAVGLSPKPFSRIVRFQNVFRSIPSGKQPDWADVAARCGYFDQAHFVRDCRQFSGETPAALWAAPGEMAAVFTTPERLDAMFAMP
jgi:AraC-like DNA-binding protein